MRIPRVKTAITQSATEWTPIDFEGAVSTLILQCRAAADSYITDKPAGVPKYYTIKSGHVLTLSDLGGIGGSIVLGSELLTNGTFTGSADGWTFNDTFWSYGTNNIAKDQNGTGALSQAVVVTANKVYKLVFTVSGYSTAGFTPSLGANNSTAITADNTYTQYITAGSTNLTLAFTPDNTSRFTLDTISLKEVIFGMLYTKGAGANTLEVLAL